MAPDYTADDYVEVFYTHSTSEARKILDVILAPEGVEGFIHDRQDHAFPAPGTQTGAVCIAVSKVDKVKAAQLLREAQESGYLTNEGVLVPGAEQAEPVTVPDEDEMTELYFTLAEVEARRIVDVVLIPEEIDAVIHDRQGHAFPAGTRAGGYVIAVPIPQAEKALTILREARRAGYLGDDGSFVTAEASPPAATEPEVTEAEQAVAEAIAAKVEAKPVEAPEK
jgi:hypothetical protein